MYELVRKKSKYVITRRDNIPSRIDKLKMPVGVIKRPAAEIEKATWKEYLLTGKSSREVVKKSVTTSWKRCLELGVDPASGKCEDIRHEKELGSEYRLLQDITEDTKTDIYTLIKDQGLLLTICDRRGYLVSMCGDYKALLAADKLNFGPGANWSEHSVGTNAIGTALASGRPMTVAGSEHFCESHHGWVCSAAPVYDLDGETIGCVDISGPKSASHSRALALAVKGARAIESRLFRTQSSSLINTVFNAVMTGLVYINLSKKITAINTSASLLLGAPSNQIIGSTVQQWFDIDGVLARLRSNPGKCNEGGLRVQCRSNNNYDTRVLPIATRSNTLAGILLVIREPQTVRSAAFTRSEKKESAFRSVIGECDGIRMAIEKAGRVASTTTTVLLTGESGTGKEVMARAIHNSGSRRKKPFIAVNCGAMPPDLIQSELFGYAEGAFTGASRGGNSGKFEQAAGGTLFLDEIGEMPLSMQVNLLRVLEDRNITRVGGKKTIPVDVRVIAATNKNLEQMTVEGRFRSDLYYRLNVVRITLPPLRNRGNDVHLLAGHFINHISTELGRHIQHIQPRFHQALTSYSWPGNVRELRHAIESAITMMPGDALRWEDLPEQIRGSEPPPEIQDNSVFNLEDIQKQTIQKAYIHYKGNISRMAKALGIGRNTLYAKMNKFDLI